MATSLTLRALRSATPIFLHDFSVSLRRIGRRHALHAVAPLGFLVASSVASALPILLTPGESATVDFSFSAPPATGVDYLRLGLVSSGSPAGPSASSQVQLFDGTSLLGTYNGSFSNLNFVGQFTAPGSLFAPALPVVNFTSIQNGTIDGRMIFTNTSTTTSVPFDSNNVVVRVSKEVGPFVTSTNLAKQPTVTSVTLGTSITPPPPTTPTTLDLAKMADNIYNLNQQAVGSYQFVGSMTDSAFGFVAYAYRKQDAVNGDQVVVSFRGTDNFKNLLADAALGTTATLSQFNTLIPRYVTDAVNFVRSVASEFPSAAQISLTGHSLGGAVADIVGTYTGLATETFNAPGTLGAYNNLSATFATLGSGSQGLVGNRPGTIRNDRIYGDQISQIGIAQGAVYTYLPQLVPNDGGATFKSILQESSTLIEKAANATANLIFTHSADNFVEWLSNSSPLVTNGISGPGLAFWVPGGCTFIGEVCATLGFVLDALANTAYHLDPPLALGDAFHVDSGPLFSKIVFPSYPDNPEYELLMWDGIDWVLSGIFSGGDVYDFGSRGSDQFLVEGYDPTTGRASLLPDDFFIGVTFLSDGHFVGHADIIYATSEPTTMALVYLGLSLYYCITRKRRSP